MNAFKHAVRTIPLDQIEGIVKDMQVTDIIDAIQEGFVAYSNGSVVVSPYRTSRYVNWYHGPFSHKL